MEPQLIECDKVVLYKEIVSILLDIFRLSPAVVTCDVSSLHMIHVYPIVFISLPLFSFQYCVRISELH